MDGIDDYHLVYDENGYSGYECLDMPVDQSAKERYASVDDADDGNRSDASSGVENDDKEPTTFQVRQRLNKQR